MFSVRLVGALVVTAAILGSTAASHAAPLSTSGFPKLQRDGTISMSGRNLRCGKARNVLDANLPSEGAAAPGVLIINPRLINRMPGVVRLFVFHHECGHHNIGASELRADSWAVERGVSEGWLDREGLKQVCRSFGNMPATPTHPSGRSRCRNLDRSFARAVAKLQKQKPADDAGAAAAANNSTGNPPTLVSGPRLIGSGAAGSGNGKATVSRSNRPPVRSVR